MNKKHRKKRNNGCANWRNAALTESSRKKTNNENKNVDWIEKRSLTISSWYSW